MSKRIQERITVKSQRLSGDGPKRRYSFELGIDDEALHLSDALSDVGAIESLERALKQALRLSVTDYVKAARALVVEVKQTRGRRLSST